MKLGVYSLQKVLFQGDAKSVNCNTRSGEITILDHHEPLISILEKGTITIVDHDQREIFIPSVPDFWKWIRAARQRSSWRKRNNFIDHASGTVRQI